MRILFTLKRGGRKFVNKQKRDQYIKNKKKKGYECYIITETKDNVHKSWTVILGKTTKF